ncbi:MAG: hypothetical protein ACOC2Y_08570 [Spirochaetota bacterium]
MRPPFIRLAVSIALCALLVPGLHGQTPDDPIIVIEVWSELDPLVADGGERPVPREVAVERLLDEATFILSGMIYGFRFSYVPADRTRQVQEEFDLTPYATIVRGDPRLEVFQTWVDRDRLYARIFYTVDEQQSHWYLGWRSAANTVSTGVGVAPFIRGPSIKTDALRDAIRMAVRNHARTIELNRPHRIAGAVIISDSPRMGVRDGNYEASVSVRMQIDEIVRYEHY